MDNDYFEDEYKVLDIYVNFVCNLLEKLGAKRVYDADRTITSFENIEKSLWKSGKHLKVTEEDKIKISFSQAIGNDKREEIKFKASRTKEVFDLLNRIGFNPVARSISHRISYELGQVDFDIDIFPGVPPFLELDLGDSKYEINELLEKIGLKDNKRVKAGTPEIYSIYGKNYFKIFSII